MIFLDIDGVLAPFGGEGPAVPTDPKTDAPESFALFATAALEGLAAIVTATKASIVLSSSWRSSEPAKQAIRDRFRSFGPPLDVAFRETNPAFHGPRQWEIAAWLAKHKPKYWVALDDEDLVEGPENRRYALLFRDHAVLVASDKGLVDNDVAQAIAILGQPSPG